MTAYVKLALIHCLLVKLSVEILKKKWSLSLQFFNYKAIIYLWRKKCTIFKKKTGIVSFELYFLLLPFNSETFSSSSFVICGTCFVELIHSFIYFFIFFISLEGRRQVGGSGWRNLKRLKNESIREHKGTMPKGEAFFL